MPLSLPKSHIGTSLHQFALFDHRAGISLLKAGAFVIPSAQTAP